MHAIIRRFAPALPAALILAAVCARPAGLSADPTQASPSAWSETDYGTVTLDDFRKDPRLQERIDLAAIDYPRLHAAVFYATNEIRRNRGLALLAYAPALERSAFGHARRMAEKNFFGHSDPFDRALAQPNDRGRRAGIANPFLAENIADTFAIVYRAGKPIYPRPGKPGEFSYEADGPLIPPHTYLSFADDVLKNWMNSSGHRANILAAEALALGCGAFLHINASNYSMPMFKAVQNFQWFQNIRSGPTED